MSSGGAEIPLLSLAGFIDHKDQDRRRFKG